MSVSRELSRAKAHEVLVWEVDQPASGRITGDSDEALPGSVPLTVRHAFYEGPTIHSIGSRLNGYFPVMFKEA